MITVGRFVLGFLLGCVLFVWAFILAGVGHGSVVPLASAAPFVFAVPKLFDQQGFWGLLSLLFMLLGTGFLWSVYFGVFPAIQAFAIRMLLVGLIAAVHVGTATLQLTKDSLLADSFNRFPFQTSGYFILFLITVLSLVVSTWVGSKRRLSPASSKPH